jgi:hypothetical protein
MVPDSSAVGSQSLDLDPCCWDRNTSWKLLLVLAFSFLFLLFSSFSHHPKEDFYGEISSPFSLDASGNVTLSAGEPFKETL